MNLERIFSKQLAGDLRQKTAEKIKKARKIPQDYKGLKEAKADFLKEEKLPEQIEESFEKIKKNIFARIFKTEKYRSEAEFLSQSLLEKKEFDINRAKKEYAEKFNEILKNCPLSLEEREAYLNTENLEKLSLEDYLTLLKRLSGEAFYHVTRYGVRENTFISTGGGHTAGEGEFVDSFTPLLEDGKINSCVSTIMADKTRAESMINREVIKSLAAEGLNEEEILNKVMSSFGTPYFLDRESAHFSYGKQLHHMYGAEDNYPIYFYYPVEYILQNDFFYSTRETQITLGAGYYHNRGGIDQQYNDFEIFNFGKGVPINAGILCISKVSVDPETGSQYLIKNGQIVLGEDGKALRPEKTITSQEYWEKYFQKNPKLKPSKVIYGGFSTSTYDSNEDLKTWAEEKKVYNQDEAKHKEFLDYQKEVRKQIKEVFREIIKKELSS